MELCGGGELFDSIVELGSFSEKKAAKVGGLAWVWARVCVVVCVYVCVCVHA